MDLTTSYLGMNLRSPLVVSACPLSDDIKNFKKMEDAGASAIVLYSLFEEQLRLEQKELFYHTASSSNISSEAMSFFPEPDEFRLGPEEYLEHIRKAKEAVKIPIIASLNGSTDGGWIDYAKKMQDAGADAIELNIYAIPTNMDMPALAIEQNYIDILKHVKSAVTVPVAIKLSPFFTNMANLAQKLDDAGADALVLFNRFYQPDIDIEALEVKPQVQLSHPNAARLPMRWIAILKGKIRANLAATSGIHSGYDAIKMLMVGADVTMLCSTLLKNGIYHLMQIEREMMEWMQEKEYESVKQMQGSMSQMRIPDPDAFERANYMKALTSYKF